MGGEDIEGGEDDVRREEKGTYRIEVSSGSVSSGISSPTDTPRGRLLAPTAELKNPIIVSGFGEGD
jgi:hypothetical protein